MHSQSTWLHTLIEACGAHLMILALVTAVSLLHGPPADAGGFGAPRVERVAASSAGPHRSAGEAAPAPLRGLSSVHLEKI